MKTESEINEMLSRAESLTPDELMEIKIYVSAVQMAKKMAEEAGANMHGQPAKQAKYPGT